MEAWEYLQPVIDVLVPRAHQQGLVSLSPTEQIVYLVWCYPGAVNNGGHASFFYNSTGQFAAETVTALQQLGEPEYAQILSRAIEQFPKCIVPHGIEERNEKFNALPARAHDVMEDCDNTFYALGDARLMARLLAFWQTAGGA